MIYANEQGKWAQHSMKILRQHGDEAYHLMSVYAMDNAKPEKSK